MTSASGVRFGRGAAGRSRLRQPPEIARVSRPRAAAAADMKLAVVLAVVCLAASSQALKCYTCKATKNISGVSLGAALNFISTAPPCTEFDPASPDDKKFLKECPTLNDKACIKLTDPDDSSNQMRGCFPKKMDECKNSMCYCDTDMCNGAGRGWPSAVLLLLAAVLAALVGR